MKIRELFSGRVLTISNLLSLARVILTPSIGYTLYMEKSTGEEWYIYCSLLILAIIILTDYLDGFIARLLNQVSRLGQFLDPVADKIAFYTIAAFLWYYKDFPSWIIWSVFIRDVIAVIGGALLFSKRDVQVRPNFFGKMMVSCMAAAAVVHLISFDIKIISISLKNLLALSILFFLIVSAVLFLQRYYKIYFENNN